MRPPAISAVLPAYNEGAVIAGVVRRTVAALQDSGIADREVVVVDDGSNDRTAARVARVAREHPEVTLVSHPRNRGYGAALRSGFAAARFETLWLMDSDGQFDPADLGLLLDAWDGEMMVAGYRARRADPWLRRANHAAFFAVVAAVMGETVRDVNCAFKLLPRRITEGLRAEGAMISTELVLEARRAGLRVVEVAVPHHPRTSGRPTGADPRVVMRAFGELYRMRRRERLRRRDRTPVGR